MPFSIASTEPIQPTGLYRSEDRYYENVATIEYVTAVRRRFQNFFAPNTWQMPRQFSEAKNRLESTGVLGDDWDGQGSPPPSEDARRLATTVLDAMYRSYIAPSHLMASTEGGIAISIIEGERGAEVEVYNTGEIAIATYSPEGVTDAWEFAGKDQGSLEESLKRIHERLVY